MDPLLAVKTAAALLALAAIGGMTLAGIRLAGSPYPPAALAMAHGLAAGAALTLLLFVAFTVGVSRGIGIAAGVLVTAAGIGTWLNLGFHARQRPIPIGPMAVHALIATAGFMVLLAALMF